MTIGSSRTDEPGCLVTGGVKGIGLATAHAFAGAGYAVTVVDTDSRPVGHDITVVRADLRDADDIVAAVAALAAGPRMAVLVNNAAVVPTTDTLTAGQEQWQSSVDLNLRAPWLLTRELLSQQHPLTSVVNVSSIHATGTRAGTFPYAMTKSGVLGLTRGMALDLAPLGVRVNAVAPGWTSTEAVVSDLERTGRGPAVNAAHPLGRMASPQEVAEVILFLASPRASGVTGAVLAVDRGMSAVMPGP